MSLLKDSSHNKTLFFYIKKKIKIDSHFYNLQIKQSTPTWKKPNLYKKKKRERELRSEPVEERREVMQ